MMNGTLRDHTQSVAQQSAQNLIEMRLTLGRIEEELFERAVEKHPLSEAPRPGFGDTVTGDLAEILHLTGLMREEIKRLDGIYARIRASNGTTEAQSPAAEPTYHPRVDVGRPSGPIR